MNGEEIGRAIRSARKSQGLTQEDLAFAAGTGLRFIGDLESGKSTCQIGKVLAVTTALGIRVILDSDNVEHAVTEVESTQSIVES